MIDVTLTREEMRYAAGVGVARQIASVFDERADGYGADRDESGWQRDIDGAIAELAVAKAYNVYWVPSVNSFQLPDLGPVSVRHSRRSDGCLIVRPHEKDSTPMVLVIGCPPILCVMGWLLGVEGKSHPLKAPNGRPPAHFAPQRCLRHTDTLRVRA